MSRNITLKTVDFFEKDSKLIRIESFMRIACYLSFLGKNKESYFADHVYIKESFISRIKDL